MDYQERLLAFGERILSCAHYDAGGDCNRELADVSSGEYRHGPEIGFVGERYGHTDLPRILFTRLNPIWSTDTGFFGTSESLVEYRNKRSGASAKELFRCYMKGWKNGSRVYRGLCDAGTVTGHPNASLLPGEQKRRSPRYGIQVIMEQMMRAGVFPQSDRSQLEFCAINNVVKCASSLPNWNPSSTMYEKCNYYQDELEILKPHILVVFGNDADRYLHSKLPGRFLSRRNSNILILSTGDQVLYFKFPHPLGPGKTTWLGSDIDGLLGNSQTNSILEQREREQFKAGPKGISTEKLFKYTLYLVNVAMTLKKR
jgi:hypothetical protein